MMHIHGQWTPLVQITRSDISDMFSLLSRHFINAHAARFESDLMAKDGAILLRDQRTGELVGFSSQAVFTHTIRGMEYRVVFSGDTIIAPHAWGSLSLPLVWGEWMMDLLRETKTPLLWMLISKGIRTYKFLPTFFEDFYPRFDQATPREILQLRDSLGSRLFPGQYDSGEGLVQPSEHSYYLTPKLAEIPGSRLSNPHVAFFTRANVSHVRGSELVCLTFFTPSNLKRDYLRRLLNREAIAREAVAYG